MGYCKDSISHLWVLYCWIPQQINKLIHFYFILWIKVH
jgi:hypothetical protein